MDFLVLLGFAFIGAIAVQLLAFSYALRTKRVDVIDVAWGPSFIGAIIAMQLHSPSSSLWVIVADILVAVWGVRLSWHIYRRFKHSQIQDERYTNLMKHWPRQYMSLQVFSRLFVVQAILAAIINLPVIVIHLYEPVNSWATMAGLAVWLIGFTFESIADRQLKDFLATPKHGQLMMSGLWRYSRHPNYFGEITMWWGIALIACITPLWWVGIIGAATISTLICFVSGVPLAEARAASKSGWNEYKQKTSVLIPWPPKQ